MHQDPLITYARELTEAERTDDDGRKLHVRLLSKNKNLRAVSTYPRWSGWPYYLLLIVEDEILKKGIFSQSSS